MNDEWTQRKAYYFEGTYDEVVILREQEGKWYLEGNYITSLYQISELACHIVNGLCEGVREEIDELIILIYENTNYTSKIVLEETCKKDTPIYDILEAVTGLICYPLECAQDTIELRLETEGGERWWIYPDRRTRYEIVEFAVKAMEEKEINEVYVYPGAEIKKGSFEECLKQYSKSIRVGEQCSNGRFERLGSLNVKAK